MKLSESRLKNKSQMYETTRDHGFGNNAYLYSVTGEFLGICANNPAVITAAVCKKPEISKIKQMGQDPMSAEIFKRRASEFQSQTKYYEMYKSDIWWVKKNFAELWVRENSRGRYNKYEVIKIYDRWNRLVIDNETHKYYQLHIIRKDFRLTLKRVPLKEMTKCKIYRNSTCTFVEIDINPYPMPRFVCDTPERREQTGYTVFAYLGKSQYAFKMTHIWQVIKKLEKLGLRFEQNDVYKTAMGFRKMK